MGVFPSILLFGPAGAAAVPISAHRRYPALNVERAVAQAEDSAADAAEIVDGFQSVSLRRAEEAPVSLEVGLPGGVLAAQ